MRNKTALAIFAHPDDEGLCGGSLARNVRNGGRSILICATRGEVGEISDPALATPETLPQVREQELRCACRVLGIEEPIFLNYRDSGMAGTADNNHPMAFVNSDEALNVGELVRQIRQLQPEAVLTFDPVGIYGHPDHVLIHRRATQAYHAAGDPSQFPEAGAAWQPARLAYVTVVREWFAKFIEGTNSQVPMSDTSPQEVLGDAETSTDEAPEWPPKDFGTPLEDVQALIDISDLTDTKRAAMNCHATQMDPNSPMAKEPPEDAKEFMLYEAYLIGAGPAKPGGKLRDLFED